jgi:hypothetical protein
MTIDFRRYWKEYLILGLILIVVILGIIASYYYRKSGQPAEIQAGANILKNPVAKVVNTFTDKNGDQHQQIKAGQNKVPQQSLSDTVRHIKGVVDSTADALNLGSPQQIEELTQEVIRLRAQIKLMSRDSAGIHMLEFHDKWLDASYNPLDSILNLHYDAKLTTTRFYKYPVPFLHFVKSADYLDFTSDDPRVSINGLKHFSVEQKPPLFGLYGDARASYMINSHSLYPSVGLGVRVNKFYVEGREYFSPLRNNFQPSVAIGYRFLNAGN